MALFGQQGGTQLQEMYGNHSVIDFALERRSQRRQVVELRPATGSVIFL